MPQSNDYAVGNSRFKRHGSVFVAELDVIAQSLANFSRLFDADYSACPPVNYFQLVVDSRKVSTERKVAVAKVDVAAYGLDDSSTNVAAILKAVAEHVENCNIRLGRNALSNANNPSHDPLSRERIEVRSICRLKRGQIIQGWVRQVANAVKQNID